MSAADELTAAADTLESLARAAEHDLATNDYWTGYDKTTAWRDGFQNGMGGEPGDLAGALPPAAVLELARWLRAEARRLSYASLPEWQETVSPHAVALARALTA
ncbi:hypothetical protein [Streptomyces scabiei]|uniref:hypothetical protein n=1 Tax=Streptomyces scabiei TaxID=1930 RepID=UPI0029B206D2|nr:hypothetical protein [Streptomyces scabiei]MDX3520746.1 hypothetical protein [Streptomyces scabiei]